MPQQRYIDDARGFMELVKQEFADRPHIYRQFIVLMREYRSNAIDLPALSFRVASLFRGHQYLIYGFNMFLPPYCKN